MFEFDQFDAGATSHASIAPGNISYASGIIRRSFLLWSEHCIECAAPECYQTCDLFKARPDQRCRRFDYGTRRNDEFSGSTGAAAEIIFSKWGKLEARGNTVLFSRRWVNSVESFLYILSPLFNLVGKWVKRLGGSSDWSALNFELLELLVRRLHRQSKTGKPPDSFLIEIYNPARRPSYLKFECAVSRSKIPAGHEAPLPYWERLTLDPGYNRFLLDYTLFSSTVTSGIPYKMSLTPEAVSDTHLIFVSLDFVEISNHVPLVAASYSSDSSPNKFPIPVSVSDSRAAATRAVATRAVATRAVATRAVAKCVVFDLDNTLWHGVLVEGEVTLKPSVMPLFKELDRRGILISVVSKNNEQDALAKIKQFGLLDYVIYPVINWSRKSENIKLLATKISIGTDSMIFIDDSAFEREEVSRAVSGIEVMPETMLDGLLEYPRLAGSTTIEAGTRRAMYQQQITREAALVEFEEDYISFLRTCRIVVSFGPSEVEHEERITELLQRTNQLNFSGTKYSRESIATIFKDSAIEKHVIHCKDKYGDYGLVGFALTSFHKNQVIVHDFMLSCRVQGKLIEKAFFSFLAKKYFENNGTLVVKFIATGRNDLAMQVLLDIGFSIGETGLSILPVQPGSLDVDFLEMS